MEAEFIFYSQLAAWSGLIHLVEALASYRPKALARLRWKPRVPGAPGLQPRAVRLCDRGECSERLMTPELLGKLQKPSVPEGRAVLGLE